VRVLYHWVAAGMWAYSRASHRVTVLGRERLEMPRGSLILVTHRRETDVPVVCPPLYRRAPLWRYPTSFAARDDMFLPGFFAGFPPGLSPRVRRALYRVNAGPFLPRVEVHPIRSAQLARLAEVLEARGDEPLPESDRAAFAERAAACGLQPPGTSREALRGEYADLLWRAVTPEDDAAAGLDGFWARRAGEAAQDFRALVDIVRGGMELLLFPEGRPSPDGEIGPIQRGLGALVRRARPAALQPVGLAYDPLVRGRTRVTVAFMPVAPVPAERIEETALDLLLLSMPLTVGQVVADLLECGSGESAEDAAVGAVRAARAEGRFVEPDLLRARRRAIRLAEALAVARRRPADVAFLAREYRSARA
jgi:1-acyl-sn-glycerol-3-phosphate acyltransferase